jgi:hypothetical protein
VKKIWRQPEQHNSRNKWHNKDDASDEDPGPSTLISEQVIAKKIAEHTQQNGVE